MTDDKQHAPASLPHEHPLYQALQRLAKDLRALFELASREDEASWSHYVELVKQELATLEAHPTVKKEELQLYRSLIHDVYDHLNMLVEVMRTSKERYKRLATRDLLTGLYNRNYFNETIVRDIERARRQGEHLSFILIDINDFKRINDTYGHLHGDGVLRACAGILRQAVRKSDFLCRYGGDEFVIVTPRATCRDNIPLFERIEERTGKWNKEFAVLDYRISFSIGCAIWKPDSDVLQVLHEADQEMYKDKKKRKNR